MALAPTPPPPHQ
jgi:hypothetical protein